LNDGTRSFAKRFAERHPQKNYPNDMQAGSMLPSFTTQAVDKVGGAADGKAVVTAMKALPTTIRCRKRLYPDRRTKIHPPICFRSRNRRNRSRSGSAEVVAPFPARMRSGRRRRRCPLVK